jgi:murein DD-endopeptidase MepM/ murein hydrolase activator NlpD
MRRLIVVIVVIAAVCGGALPASAAGTWPWPVVGPVIRGYDPPDSPYGSGHRGIDIGAAYGTPVVAPAAGTVSFSGKVGGYLFLTIQHGGGVSSSYSWVSALLVKKSDVVGAGQVVALTGQGHPGSDVTHLHFAVKLDGVYVNPLDYLSAGSVVDLIRLVPVPPP